MRFFFFDSNCHQTNYDCVKENNFLKKKKKLQFIFINKTKIEDEKKMSGKWFGNCMNVPRWRIPMCLTKTFAHFVQWLFQILPFWICLNKFTLVVLTCVCLNEMQNQLRCFFVLFYWNWKMFEFVWFLILICLW